MKTIIARFTIFFLLLNHISFSQTTKILFDASKAEMAGDADWVIDADLHNIGFSGGPAIIGGGNESNPQRIPTPAQSGITGSTVQSYWTGAISYWGIDCVNQNYIVESLPYNGLITYGNVNNPQDLSNYNVYIVCEPNILFTASEKTAILNFVQNGGGLFMISDHNSSDRNNDGQDSPHIWNDLMTINSVQANPFGIKFDYASFSQTTSNIPALPTDSILHGPAGNVTQAQWSAGTSMTINTAQNSSVKGVIYKTDASFGSINVMCAYARFGNGKVAAIGDSSPCDDGSGGPGDQLYDGYIANANGNHRKLLMNITIWLATQSSQSPPTADFTASPLSVCIGQATTFTNASSSGVSTYAWNFGSGATPSTANTVGPHSVSYSTSGTKTVSLTVTNGVGSSTATKSNYITVPVTCTTTDMGVLSLLSPTSPICPTDAQVLKVRVKNYNGTTINFSTNQMDVILTITNPSSIQQSFTKTISSGSLNAGATLDVTFDQTYNLSTSGNYLFNSNTVVSTDANATNNAMATATITVSPGFETDYTVITETMGSVSSTTSIANHETANGFDNDLLTMSGSADVRVTQTSAGAYTGASGGANVFFTNTVGKNFIIDGINTSLYSNLQLSFGLYKNTASTSVSDSFFVKVSSDGTNYTSLTIPSLPASIGWNYVTVSGPIPLTNNLRIQFIQNGKSTPSQCRVDDLLLIDAVTAPTITPQGAITFCQGGSVTLNSTLASSYIWSNGATTQNITVGTAGDYTVTETNALGCTGVSPSVTVAVNPIYNIIVNASFCPGTSYTLPNGSIVSAAGNYISNLLTIFGCDSIITTNLSIIQTNDNNFCTTDACNTTTGSVTHIPVNTDDGNSCTTDACISSSGIITHTLINIDDGNACTTDECNSSNGTITHTAIIIDDGNGCTTDACNISSGVITHTLIIIDDGNACTTDECNSTNGNITHAPVNPDDNNICTLDGCDSVTGIFHSTLPEICDNGIDDNCNGSIDEGCPTTTAITLNIKLFFEGYYLGNEQMQPVLYNEGKSNDQSICDTITIELHDEASPHNLIETRKTLLHTDGTAIALFPNTTFNHFYYIVVKQRNSIVIWSKESVLFNSQIMNFDFSR